MDFVHSCILPFVFMSMYALNGFLSRVGAKKLLLFGPDILICVMLYGAGPKVNILS